jgi:hypothetical protein
MTTFTRIALFSLLAAPLLVACSEEEPAGPPEFLATSSGTLALNPSNRALFATPIRSLYTTVDVFGTDLDVANHVILQSQMHSELGFLRTGDANAASFSQQIEEFWDEDFGVQIIDRADTQVTLVLDLHRMNREWLVDWRGLERDEPGNRESSFTFQIRQSANNSDFQQAIVGELLDALDVLDPSESPVVRVVVGTEMERHYLSAPQDWPYFVALVRLLDSSLAERFPTVQLSVGINWSNFMETVVPVFVDAEAGETGVTFPAVQRAWSAVIDPLYYAEDDLTSLAEDADYEATPLLDFYAFASIPDPSLYENSAVNLPDTHYTGIPTMFDLQPFRADLPLVWFNVGWPVDSESPERAGVFLERFLALNATDDYDVKPNHSMVAWWGYNYPLENECNQLSDPGNINAGLNVCFRGLYGTIPQVSNRTRLMRAFFGQ